MTSKKLTKLLEQLHDELANTEVMDEKGRDLLRALNADIQALLERADDETDDDDSLLARLQETIAHFEVTHPNLTAALSQMLNALNNAGI